MLCGWLLAGQVLAQTLDPALLELEYQLPDPGAAATLSGVVGFGAGHFYAEQPGTGTMHLLVQLVGAGLLAGGAIAASSGEAEPSTIRGLNVAGGAILGVGRAVDTVMAPYSARTTALDRLQRVQRPRIEVTEGADLVGRDSLSAGDVAVATTIKIYQELGWPIEPRSEQWQEDVDVIKRYLARGRMASELIVAAKQGADTMGMPARLDVYLQAALGE